MDGYSKQCDGICMTVPLFVCAQTFVALFVHVLEVHKTGCCIACLEQLIKMVQVSVSELVIWASCAFLLTALICRSVS